MAYFKLLDEHSYRATEQVGGAWDTETQHIAPALGLLTHAIETDRDRRRTDRLAVGRLTFDILGTIPVDVVDVRVEVRRPGRTVELVEATLSHAGRPAVLARVWLLQPRDLGTLQGSPMRGDALRAIPRPAQLSAWDPSSMWPGGFIASVEVRRQQLGPGRGWFWVRTPVPLIDGVEVSQLAGAVGLFDIANGMTPRADPRRVVFPNLDLTAHLFREPSGEWVGFDTTVSFGPDGVGLTSSVLHDVHGPIGMLAQGLTVRPG